MLRLLSLGKNGLSYCAALTSTSRKRARDFEQQKSGIAMKRVLYGAVFLSVVALVAPAGIANAADLPVKAYSPVPPPVTGPLWEGIYMGGNIGNAWGKASWCTEENAFSCEVAGPHDVTSASPNGLVGGGQFGDRWQFGNVVFGLEGLYDGLNVTTTKPGFGAVGETLRTKFTGLFSATGQLGLAVDRLLFYGKGGWASTDLKLQVNEPGAVLNGSNWIDGWTVGGGIEYQIVPHLIVGVEYDYYKFAPGNLTNISDSTGTAIACSFCNFGSSVTLQTVMARLSYQAGPPPARW